MVIILIIVGLLIGASLEGINGAVIGALLGGISGFAFKLQEQLQSLKFKHNKLQDDFSRLSQHYEKHQFAINETQEPEISHQAEVDTSSSTIENEELNLEPEPILSDDKDPAFVQTIPSRPVPHFDNEINNTVQVSTKAPDTPPSSKSTNNGSAPVTNKKPNPFFGFVHDFIFTGNPIVKIASVVLFFGVAFLLKYAAEQNYFPIQWRFISVALVAIALLVWGLKLTPKKRQYGLVIQGLSIGVLYLTTYAASSLYPLLPLNLAFFCLLILSVVSATLSVKQNAPSLAIIAVIGGFLAPILTSSGTNAYVKLFSYYAVLNLGILFISVFKSWRFLCWLGFAFTFVIGSFWGYQSYQPAFFESTEPFLLFHFLLYLAIPILFLRLNHLPAKPIIQTTIVFGLPTISFLLQLYMVQDFPHGKTFSALGWSAAYFLGSLAIHLLPNKDKDSSKNLKISYLGIGITFFSIFLFFLFEQDVTSILWAFEAVGLTWLGIRQKEFFPKLAGWILITLSTLLYLDQYNAYAFRDIFLNAQFFSGLLIAISALAIGYFYSPSKNLDFNKPSFEQISSTLLLVASTLFILILSFNELYLLSVQNYLIPAFTICITLLSAAYFIIGSLTNWKLMQQASLLAIPALALLSLIHFVDNFSQNPIAYLGFIAYPLSITSSLFILRKTISSKYISHTLYKVLASILYLTSIFVVTWIMAFYAKQLSSNGDWFLLIFGLLPTIALFHNYRIYLPLSEEHRDKPVLSILQVSLCAYLGAWFLMTTFSTLHPENLPYLPVLNPLELTHGFLLYTFYKVIKNNPAINNAINFSSFQYGFYLIAFVFINIIVARNFHHYSGIPFEASKLLSEPRFLLTLTIVWSLLATIVMYFAKAQQSRSLWITGASLLVAILIKLIVFDMADSGTLTRIVSFLVVGAIMLAIGYFVPMPPNKDET